MLNRTMIAACVLQLIALSAVADDPSSVPVRTFNGERYAERWRILVDLNVDGVQDMVLSDGMETFGTGGGGWDVYLNRTGEYERIGRIGAHPRAVAFESDQDRYQTDVERRRYTRIWTYWHMSCASGALGYYRVGEETVDECRSVDVYAGDAGTALGNAVYGAVFKNSEIPFSLECSTTDDEGRVSWAADRR